MLSTGSTDELGILLVYLEAETQPDPCLPSEELFIYFSYLYFNFKRILPPLLRLGDPVCSRRPLSLHSVSRGHSDSTAHFPGGHPQLGSHCAVGRGADALYESE